MFWIFISAILDSIRRKDGETPIRARTILFYEISIYRDTTEDHKKAIGARTIEYIEKKPVGGAKTSRVVMEIRVRICILTSGWGKKQMQFTNFVLTLHWVYRVGPFYGVPKAIQIPKQASHTMP
jgi:hypothetical protein